MRRKNTSTEIAEHLKPQIARRLIERAAGGQGKFLLVYYDPNGNIEMRMHSESMTATNFKDARDYAHEQACKKEKVAVRPFEPVEP